MQSLTMIVSVLIGGVLICLWGVVVLIFLNTWLFALLAGRPVSLFALIGMRIRGSNPKAIVAAQIELARAGMLVNTRSLEACCLAGVEVSEVVSALIAADVVGIELEIEELTAVALAGYDLQAYVEQIAREGHTRDVTCEVREVE